MFRLAFLTALALAVTVLAVQSEWLGQGDTQAQASSADPASAYAEVRPEAALRGEYLSTGQ